MRKIYFLSFLGLFFGINTFAQKVTFEEYDLSNGLHVILYQDNSAPVVTTSVMYHVGSKNEVPGRTGFAHFLNTFYLKEPKTLKEEIGLKLFPQMEGLTMQTQPKIEPIITKFFLLTI